MTGVASSHSCKPISLGCYRVGDTLDGVIKSNEALGADFVISYPKSASRIIV